MDGDAPPALSSSPPACSRLSPTGRSRPRACPCAPLVSSHGVLRRSFPLRRSTAALHPPPSPRHSFPGWRAPCRLRHTIHSLVWNPVTAIPVRADSPRTPSSPSASDPTSTLERVIAYNVTPELLNSNFLSAMIFSTLSFSPSRHFQYF